MHLHDINLDMPGLQAPECSPESLRELISYIKADQALVAAANARMAKWHKQLGPVLRPLEEGDLGDLMSIENYEHCAKIGLLTGEDGHGVWATETHRSDLSADSGRPKWATRVHWSHRSWFTR